MALGSRVINIRVEEVAKDNYEEILALEVTCANKSTLFGFPYSCRLAYVESIKYIYSENTFLLYNRRAPLCLSSIMSPKFLHSITSVGLHWRASSEEEKLAMASLEPNQIWTQACFSLAAMQNLRHLRILLDKRNGYGYGFWPDDISLFTPICQIKNVSPPYLHVEANWSCLTAETSPPWLVEKCNKVQEKEGTWPFKLHRSLKTTETSACDYPGCEDLDSVLDTTVCIACGKVH
ncbi:hypothetical protein BDV96DRAFT_655464 [Lophiotrema nucula]|uniref:DUF7730 domain-containing protein n=1 Tax=Lophiotrema nucula TaxID=690887 RepID=A0A6A5YHI2_9PLEO|nr:hypothetical protein BDV96DRAFT_655464 [Lophiotrema nucula]